MEAFVYCWYNDQNNKKYIGYHKGQVNDGYVSSSGNADFWRDYNDGKLKRQIIAHGTIKDCQRLERKLFENIDWKSDEYYNIAVGGSVNFALNNPMFREEVRKKISAVHKNKLVSKDTRKKLAKAQTGKKQSEETKDKHRKRMLGNKHARGVIRIENHKNILSQKALNNNPMKNEESRKKVSLSKIDTKSLYKNGKMKKAKPNSDKWNALINDGWCIKGKINGST
jgi:hypothetical protein